MRVLLPTVGYDTLSGYAGADTISGGDGFDAVYVTGGSGLSLNLAASTVEWIADFVGGNDSLDRFDDKIKRGFVAGNIGGTFWSAG